MSLKLITMVKSYDFAQCRLTFCQKLDRALTYRHHLVALRKKLSPRVSLLRRLAGSGCDAGAKTLRRAALSLIYSTAESEHQLGIPARILAFLTAFIMTLCALSLDDYVPLQRKTFQFSQAPSQLSFAAKERHSPWLIAVI